jgi:putative membrane protein
MKRLRLLAAVSAAVLCMGSAAWAANSTTNDPAASGASPNSQDQQFVRQTAAGNKAEAALGKMAEQKAATPAVREFGRWMFTDHTFANNQLKTIAEQMHVWSTPQLTRSQKDMKQRLQNASGQQFDQEYLSGMVADHQKTIQKFTKEASSGQNPRIKTYANTLLPVLKQHLAEAQMLLSGGNRVVENPHSGAAAAPATTGSSVPPKTRH